MKGAAAINYVMKPSTTGSLILEATATELIQYSPINILNGAAQMEAKYVHFISDSKPDVHATLEYVLSGIRNTAFIRVSSLKNRWVFAEGFRLTIHLNK